MRHPDRVASCCGSSGGGCRRFLTKEGQVETDGTTKYFPQRLGLPDDTGGSMYSPDASPLDSDLYGIFCRSPIPLGDDWWMCGMPDYWR
jgi:hypothetical protein